MKFAVTSDRPAGAGAAISALAAVIGVVLTGCGLNSNGEGLFRDATSSSATSGSGGANTTTGENATTGGNGGNTTSSGNGSSGGTGGGAEASSTSGSGGAASATGTSGSATSATSGSSASSGGTGGGPACPSLGDECTDCAATECSDLYCGCFETSDCKDLALCTMACGDDADCNQDCRDQHEDSISEAILVQHCTALRCARACPDSVPLSSCAFCLFTSCEEQMNACLANGACADILACAEDCQDDGCRAACAAQHPTGTGDAIAVNDCLNRNCPVECR